MRTIRLTYPFSITDSIPDPRIVLTIGFFDGVHLGHQEVIQKALSISRIEQIPVAVMTFDPHPREFLGYIKEPRFITPLEEKLKHFADLGLDYAIVMEFNEAFSHITAQSFVSQFLPNLHAETIVVGYNFTFGHRGQGTVDQLREWTTGNLKVNVVRPYIDDDEKVSSTLVREKMSAGNMKRVKELLNRPYSIRGIVIEGKKLGRTIGFPTANIALSDRFAIPKFGVYAVKANLEGVSYYGVMNIGVRPTVDDTKIPSLELHLFNFERDIYGQHIQVHFIDFIRAEMKFSSIEELAQQIAKDVEHAKRILQQQE